VVYPADAELTEEEMILANAASESKQAEQTIQKAALVLTMREGIGSMARILKTIEVSSMTPCHTCFAQVSFRG
jgi:tyrosine 3-monooxygenase